MSGHYDITFPKVLANCQLPFLQVSASLSMKGRDYIEGGGFVIEKNSENKVFTDRTHKRSSLITIFDGSCLHGVDEVDPFRNLSFNPTYMRSTLFAGLYPFKN